MQKEGFSFTHNFTRAKIVPKPLQVLITPCEQSARMFWRRQMWHSSVNQDIIVYLDIMVIKIINDA